MDLDKLRTSHQLPCPSPALPQAAGLTFLATVNVELLLPSIPEMGGNALGVPLDLEVLFVEFSSTRHGDGLKNRVGQVQEEESHS